MQTEMNLLLFKYIRTGNQTGLTDIARDLLGQMENPAYQGLFVFVVGAIISPNERLNLLTQSFERIDYIGGLHDDALQLLRSTIPTIKDIRKALGAWILYGEQCGPASSFYPEVIGNIKQFISSGRINNELALKARAFVLDYSGNRMNDTRKIIELSKQVRDVNICLEALTVTIRRCPKPLREEVALEIIKMLRHPDAEEITQVNAFEAIRSRLPNNKAICRIAGRSLTSPAPLRMEAEVFNFEAERKRIQIQQGRPELARK